MLPLPRFELFVPGSLPEAHKIMSECVAQGRSVKLVAGGTDILVNLKHRFVDVDALVHLGGIDALTHVEIGDDGSIDIGAGVTLAALRDNLQIQHALPALAYAAGQVASPQIQNMGTLGGNVCLDTRCVYINQTHFWRQALGYCLKKDGTVCHVVKGGKLCVAAQSSDTVPVLLNYDATLNVLGEDGPRTMPLASLYKKDGAQHLTLAPGDIVTTIHIPPRPEGYRETYVKHRTRKSIDFPVMSLAVAVALDDDDLIKDLRITATCLGSRPRRISRLDKIANGNPLGDELIDAIAAQCQKQINPLDNIMVEIEWRKKMVPVLVKRAFGRLMG